MNGIIVINKPAGWTSHDVVGKLRGVLREKRIGHGGTLDPMATGVLPVFVGRATRAVEFCENAVKEYTAGLKTGVITDTQDTTGVILERRDADVTARDVENALAHFLGEQEQIPPMYSAVKVGGKKLYELARKGIEVERKPRRILISRLELIAADGNGFTLRVECSKGTYIRTLCSDIGEYLGCGAAMSSLIRTRAGAFTLDNAVTLDEVAAAAEAGQAEKLLSPVDSLFSDLPAVYADAEQERRCRNGNEYPSDIGDGRYRVYSKDGSFLMVGDADRGVMKTVKSFFEV